MTLAVLLDRLREFDLLLDTDPKFPSITSLVVGDAIRGPWWSHPRAKEVYRLSCELRSHPDVLMIKLISGKVTAIHRPLWPAILAIGQAREPWQVAKLSNEAKVLLKKVDKQGVVEATGDAVRELEKSLLVFAESVHTEHGHHAKRVESWDHWAEINSVPAMSAGEAKHQLERIVTRLNNQFSATGSLPWAPRRRWHPV